MPSTIKSEFIVRNLPGFSAVEDAALLYGGHRLAEEADRFTKRHFNLRVDDLFDLRPDQTAEVIDPSQLKQELQRHQHQLFADDLSDDEMVELLSIFGVDLCCERGLPLRCTKAIGLQVEAAARGLAGKLPDRAEIEVEAFALQLSAEAAAFAAKKQARAR